MFPTKKTTNGETDKVRYRVDVPNLGESSQKPSITLYYLMEILDYREAPIQKKCKINYK